MNKKAIWVFLGSLTLFNIIPSVSAQEAMESVFESIYKFFNWLPQQLTAEGIMSGDPKSVFLARFLIWIILFTITFFGIGLIPGFKEQRGPRIAIAFVIGVMGAALIPQQILVNVFQTYSMVGAVIIMSLPLLAGWYLMSKLSPERHGFLRAFIYAMAFVILFRMNTAMDQLAGRTWKDLESYLGYFKLLYIPILFGFFNSLRRAMPGKGAAERMPSVKPTGETPEQKEVEKEVKEAEKTEKAAEGEEAYDEKLTKIMEKTEEKGKKYNEKIIEILQGIITHIKEGITKETVKKINEDIGKVRDLVKDVHELFGGKLNKLIEKYEAITKNEYYIAIYAEKDIKKVKNRIKYKVGHARLIFKSAEPGKSLTPDDEEAKIEQLINKIKEEIKTQEQGIEIIASVHKNIEEFERKFSEFLTEGIRLLSPPQNIQGSIDNIKESIRIKRQEDLLISQAKDKEGALIQLEEYVKKLHAKILEDFGLL